MPATVVIADDATGRTKNRVVFWSPNDKVLTPWCGCPQISKSEYKKILRIARYWIELGAFPDNREKFKPVADGLFEIKCFQIRMLGFYDHNDFVTVLCVRKKKDNPNKGDVKKAKELRGEYFKLKK